MAPKEKSLEERMLSGEVGLLNCSVGMPLLLRHEDISAD